MSYIGDMGYIGYMGGRFQGLHRYAGHIVTDRGGMRSPCNLCNVFNPFNPFDPFDPLNPCNPRNGTS